MVFFLKIAEEIRATVFEDTSLTCSAGVAPNRLLAKVLLTIHIQISIMSLRNLNLEC